MNLNATGKSLVVLTKDLSLLWEQTQASWHDARSREFERQYLAELLASVDHALPVLEQLDKVIAKVRSDCE
ncbi:MAG: hypothetical protein JXQ71_13990 [Verrucomicrobia bacterium]|nr:hypothetical protein [Verrucomicrobiota bacterium]